MTNKFFLYSFDIDRIYFTINILFLISNVIQCVTLFNNLNEMK